MEIESIISFILETNYLELTTHVPENYAFPENSWRKHGQGVEQRLDEVIFLTGKPEKRVWRWKISFPDKLGSAITVITEVILEVETLKEKILWGMGYLLGGNVVWKSSRIVVISWPWSGKNGNRLVGKKISLNIHFFPFFLFLNIVYTFRFLILFWISIRILTVEWNKQRKKLVRQYLRSCWEKSFFS